MANDIASAMEAKLNRAGVPTQETQGESKYKIYADILGVSQTEVKRLENDGKLEEAVANLKKAAQSLGIEKRDKKIMILTTESTHKRLKKMKKANKYRSVNDLINKALEEYLDNHE